MICNTCNIPMTQKDKIGGGVASDKEYFTWEVKECGNCGRLVKEYYSATVISKEELKKLK